MPIPPGLEDDDLSRGEDAVDEAGGFQHGETHTRRPELTEALKGQGAKTRARNKEIAQGKPYRR